MIAKSDKLSYEDGENIIVKGWKLCFVNDKETIV